MSDVHGREPRFPTVVASAMGLPQGLNRASDANCRIPDSCEKKTNVAVESSRNPKCQRTAPQATAAA